MSATLPRHPSLQHLKKQAKQLLAAHRRGAPQVCTLLRQLHRFSSSTDQEILAARFTLTEAQFALALHYGFSSWKELLEDVHSRPATDENSLEAVHLRAEEDIPEYGGAGVPVAVVAAMNHAGIPLGFMEFAAASGWAFSFGYHYEDISPAYMAVRGRPGFDGPLEVFAFLPLGYGLEYEMAPTSEPDQVWEFVKPRVDSGTPIMSEQMDGGLISGYRIHRGRRQIFFDGTVMPGWMDVTDLQPFGVYSFVQARPPKPRDEILRSSLRRALEKGRAPAWKGTPQGGSALKQYLADVSDPDKDFAEVEEWFCWATFERLMARRCAEVWLRSVAGSVPAQVRSTFAEAADRYGEAFRSYDLFCGEVQACDPPGRILRERARSPERIEEIVPILQKGIAAEEAGLEALEEGLKKMG